MLDKLFLIPHKYVQIWRLLNLVLMSGSSDPTRENIMAHGYDPDCSCGRCTAQTRKYIRAGHTPGAKPQGNPGFGSGTVGGDKNWTSPVYGQTASGQDVTVSFGQDGRAGHTGIASGHVSGESYYGKGGHDHYGSEGESHADRGAYRE